jgi:transcriptional regulator with XRE-family HTH domain
MTQANRIIDVLKDALRANGVTYDQVAMHLGLSTSSVKRLFSRGGFTLARLEEVAEIAGVDLVELARRGEERRAKTHALTHAQESELVRDPRLVLVAICALNRWRFKDILDVYQFGEPELIGLLVSLDKLGLIELLPSNRIRLLIERDFSWLPQGPIHHFFVRQFQAQFLSGEFSGASDVYEFRWGMVAPEHAMVFSQQLRAGLENFTEFSRMDEVRPRGNTNGMCLLVAFKEWEPEEFQGMRG